ncbi:response regulator receiver domain-containing protein [Chitinophaga skermanii]|uniref:Response regulator receiver domain-containing protein n=1 Tax=Chitinophaga skermanii TaxID=331697 RepID=A0A327QCH0_9BACT|nr:response regulator [Chitinophaga skermanii]RAJ02346.1 response regulator receiver domain-containing protein [Chitinophaga skermanii]
MQQPTFKILLADDDQDDQIILIEALQEAQPFIDIATVFNGKEAIQYLSTLSPSDYPNLIILDYKMPIYNAADVLSKMEPAYKGIPTVVWSTSNQSEHIEQCLSLGALKYFTKPSSQPELSQLVSDIFVICQPQVEKL